MNGGLSMRLSGNWRQRLSRYLELNVLATIFVFAAASFTFLKLLSEMREGDTRSADQAILLALRDPSDLSNPIGPDWVETMCRDLTSLGSPTVLSLIAIAAVSYLWIDGKRATALFAALSIIGGAVLVSLLKFGFARPRPELVSHLVNVNSFSFPSGHADNGRGYLSYPWRPPGARTETAAHENLRAGRRVCCCASGGVHACLSWRPLANGRSRRVVHWNGLGCRVLACGDLASTSRRY